MLILCSNRPSDPAEEDARNSAVLFSAAQYLQHTQRAAAAEAAAAAAHPALARMARAAWQAARLKCAPHGGCGRAAAAGSGCPAFYVQVVLPESRDSILEAMQQMCEPEAAQNSVCDSRLKDEGNRGGTCGAGCWEGGDVVAEVRLGHGSGAGTSTSSGGLCSGARQPCFWRRFAATLRVHCAAEMRHALLGAAANGCAGLVALVSNLVHGVDGGDMLPSEVHL